MEHDIRQVTTTDLNSLTDYSVSSQSIDSPSDVETYYDSPNFAKYNGYYKKIPELHQAINAIAIWTAGKGWTSPNVQTKIDLDHLKGWGEDTFQSIMENMIIMKKVNGDAFAEIIRDSKKNRLINLKPLAPNRIRIVVGPDGRIKRYEELNRYGNRTNKKFEVKDIFHISNDRVADEIHGNSVIEACEFVIKARNEAMEDWKRVLHRSSIRVMYVDEDDTTRLRTLKTEFKEAINKGELLILPGKEEDFNLKDYSAPPSQPYMETIRYYENFFYQAVGTPKVILGGSSDYTEASSKVGYLTFEQVYMREQRELEGDLWSQLGIKVEFERPVSLKDEMMTSEAANTGQTGFQPNEVTAQVGRTE